MFSKTTADFVHRYDRGGTLIEAHLNDSDKLVPMALVIKKKRQWWQKPKYRTSNFTLSDLLRGKSTSEPLSPGVTTSDFGCFTGGLTATGGLGAIGGILKGNLNKQTSYNLGNLKKQRVDISKLHTNSSNRRVDMQQVLVRRLKKGDVLALLTERIITSSDCHLSEHRDCTGDVKLSKETLPAAFNHDCVDGKVKLKRQDSMVIPPGTVIAYSLEDIKIRQDGCFDWYDTDGGIESDAFNFEEEGLALDSIALQKIPQETRSDLFQKFCELMKDRDALSDVENTLEEWCSGDAAVETEQDLSEDLSSLSLSACHGNSSAILDLLRPYLTRPDPDSHSESDGSPGGPLAAVHLLVSAMEELPDEALTLLCESSPDVLEAFNALVNMLDLKDQKESCSPLPLESLPLPLQDDKAFHWVEQLLITCHVTLSREAGGLSAERGSNEGVLPLVLCITVQGLCYLCAQQN